MSPDITQRPLGPRHLGWNDRETGRGPTGPGPVWGQPPALMRGPTGENGRGAVGAVRSRTFKKHLLCTCTTQTARETLWPPAGSTHISPTPTAPRGFRQPPSCPRSSAGPGAFRILATRGRALPRNRWHRPCSAPLADSPLPCGQTASRRALLTRAPRDGWQPGGHRCLGPGS